MLTVKLRHVYRASDCGNKGLLGFLASVLAEKKAVLCHCLLSIFFRGGTLNHTSLSSQAQCSHHLSAGPL